ncbi:hypothetical protein GCM10009836_59650 [Pseudonocardia ailaonensis]|uniref:Apea-like HEPN domain-containing protein n=1 Tax=Pseudonocardia ailaonensis TaxID=367279 RepID=A0ABN2NK93_9PSEU
MIDFSLWTVLLGAIPALIGAATAIAIAAISARRSRKVEMSVRDPQSGIRIEVSVDGRRDDVEATVNEIIGIVTARRGDDFELVRMIADIEGAANTVLTERLGSQRRESRGLFSIRRDLIDTGILDSDDVKRLDRIFKVRNAIVHGDEYERQSVAPAKTEAAALLKKIQAARSTGIN